MKRSRHYRRIISPPQKSYNPVQTPRRKKRIHKLYLKMKTSQRLLTKKFRLKLPLKNRKGKTFKIKEDLINRDQKFIVSKKQANRIATVRMSYRLMRIINLRHPHLLSLFRNCDRQIETFKKFLWNYRFERQISVIISLSAFNTLKVILTFLSPENRNLPGPTKEKVQLKILNQKKNLKLHPKYAKRC